MDGHTNIKTEVFIALNQFSSGDDGHVFGSRSYTVFRFWGMCVIGEDCFENQISRYLLVLSKNVHQISSAWRDK